MINSLIFISTVMVNTENRQVNKISTDVHLHKMTTNQIFNLSSKIQVSYLKKKYFATGKIPM